MVKRLGDMPEIEAMHLRRIECPSYDDTPPLAGKRLSERRVVIISTAGLHRRGDRPFRPGDGSYRIIPALEAIGPMVLFGPRLAGRAVRSRYSFRRQFSAQFRHFGVGDRTPTLQACSARDTRSARR